MEVTNFNNYGTYNEVEAGATQINNYYGGNGRQEGLLSNTFRNNPYMRLHVDKWKENGAKERVLRLTDAYENAVQKRLNE